VSQIAQSASGILGAATSPARRFAEKHNMQPQYRFPADPAKAGAIPGARTDGYRIEVCDDSAGRDWNRLIETTDGGSFYHLWDWRQINHTSLGHRTFYLAAKRVDGAFAGVLPLTLVSSRLFGRILCSMPFVNFGGPCAADRSIAKALVTAAIDKANDSDVDYLELRCSHELAELDLPVSLHKVSMTIDLSSGEDAIWNGFSAKHRKNVRRAYKNGLSVRSGGAELLPTFYSLMEQSWRNLGTPLYRRSYFESILQAFQGQTQIFVCVHENRPIAAALTGYFNGVVEGMWAGGTDLARRLDANYALYWEMIRDACARGCRVFHLGRSTADGGGEIFKRKWNAVPTQLYWYSHLARRQTLPQLNVDNPRYRLAIKAWRHFPLWATRLLGPPLARLIP
jgi:FemAB-related protein (PEP-CTERM system-associated)